MCCVCLWFDQRACDHLVNLLLYVVVTLLLYVVVTLLRHECSQDVAMQFGIQVQFNGVINCTSHRYLIAMPPTITIFGIMGAALVYACMWG